MAIVVVSLCQPLWGLWKWFLAGHVEPYCSLFLLQEQRVLESFKICSMNEVLALWLLCWHWKSGARCPGDRRYAGCNQNGLKRSAKMVSIATPQRFKSRS